MFIFFSLVLVFLNSKKPVACLIGGSKISTKIDLIINLMPKMDFMIIGGAMANNFFKHETSRYNLKADK